MWQLSSIPRAEVETRNRIHRKRWTRNRRIVKRINCQSRSDRDGRSQLVGEENPINRDREGLLRASLHVDLDYLPALSSAVNDGPWLGNRFVTIHVEIAEHIGCVWGIRFPTWSPSALLFDKMVRQTI